jgi:hypothetical protein
MQNSNSGVMVSRGLATPGTTRYFTYNWPTVGKTIAYMAIVTGVVGATYFHTDGTSEFSRVNQWTVEKALGYCGPNGWREITQTEAEAMVSGVRYFIAGSMGSYGAVAPVSNARVTWYDSRDGSSEKSQTTSLNDLLLSPTYYREVPAAEFFQSFPAANPNRLLGSPAPAPTPAPTPAPSTPLIEFSLTAKVNLPTPPQLVNLWTLKHGTVVTIPGEDGEFLIQLGRAAGQWAGAFSTTHGSHSFSKETDSDLKGTVVGRLTANGIERTPDPTPAKPELPLVQVAACEPGEIVFGNFTGDPYLVRNQDGRRLAVSLDGSSASVMAGSCVRRSGSKLNLAGLQLHQLIK